MIKITLDGVDGVIPPTPLSYEVTKYRIYVPQDIVAIKVLSYVLEHDSYSIEYECLSLGTQVITYHVPFVAPNSPTYIIKREGMIVITSTMATLDTLEIAITIESFNQYLANYRSNTR